MLIKKPTKLHFSISNCVCDILQMSVDYMNESLDQDIKMENECYMLLPHSW